MSIRSLSFLRLVGIVAISLCLAGCSKAESYRYKLTLAVNTPEGIKRGSTVVEVLFYDVSFPARGTMHKLRGEALYLDLGLGARPLVALLTSQLHPKIDHGRQLHWTRDAGPAEDLLAQLNGRALSVDYMNDLPRIARMRGPHRIAPTELPDLVTFVDVNDPKSVLEVNPNDIQAALGPNITWNEVTLESTNEPITTGIVQKLPWLRAYYNKNWRLDGVDLHSTRELANTLSWFDFDQSGDL